MDGKCMAPCDHDGLALNLSACTVDTSVIQAVVSSFSKSSQPHWATSHLDTSVKCAISYWLVALQPIPCLHSAFYDKRPMSLKRLCAVFLVLTQLRCAIAIFYPASWLPLYHLISTWLQLPPFSTRHRSWTHSVHAIANKLHFILHAMATLIVRSWIVHLTPIP